MLTRQSTITTDANGNYRFNDLPAGTYVVIPDTEGSKAFAPQFRRVVIVGDDATDEDFAALDVQPPQPPVPQPWIISGTVTSVFTTGTAQYGGPYKPEVSGGAIFLTGPMPQQTVLSDSDGKFLFSGLANGTYTITFSKYGHTGNPSSQTVVVNDNNVVLTNIVVTVAYLLSGTIRYESSANVGVGWQVDITGPRTATVITAVTTGLWQLSNVPPGVYTVTPRQAGYRFDPPSRTITMVTAHSPNNDFTAIPL